jgi:predicted nucleic acid-binding protein
MGRKNYLVDTNIAIYYFALLLEQESESSLEDILRNKYFISVINRIELLGNKNIEPKEQDALDSFINNAVVINLDEEIILKTIEIRKKYATKLPDAIIAATCLLNPKLSGLNNLSRLIFRESEKALYLGLTPI